MKRAVTLVLTTALLTIAAALCFYNLGVLPLSQWDEKTNAQVVSELSARWPSPILTYQGVAFMEKPPLWYLTTAAVTKIAGLNNYSLRIISAASGFLLVSLVYFFSRRYFSPLAGVFALLVLIGSGQLFTTGAGGLFATHHFRSADADHMHILLMFISFAALVPA